MATQTKNIFYRDRDNEIDVILEEGDVAISQTQMEAITKVSVHYLDAYYNSTDHPTAFDYVTYKASGKMTLKLGTVLPVGSDRKAELIVYDLENTNGIVWDQLYIQVSAEAEV